MHIIKCLIVDDEPYARKLIAEYAEKIPFLEVVAICKDAWEVLDQLEKIQVDLLLLDIEMPEWDGISLLKTWSSAPKAIFITAHRHYAVQAFDLEVVDYLLKPVSFERFLKAIHRFQKLHVPAFENQSVVVGNALFLKHNRQMVRIYYDDIMYLEVMGDYVKVIKKSGDNILSKITLKELMVKLPDSAFLQVHRSFVVAKDKVVAFTADKIKVGERWITVSRPFREVVKQMWGE